MEAGTVGPQKAHRPSRMKEKSKKKKNSSPGTGGKKQAVAKPGAFARRVRLTADRSEKRVANPTAPVDRTGGDAAPRLVTVVGPKGVGKSTIIRNLVKHYSKRSIPTITGPITIVAGRRKRITFLEIGPDLSSMIDAAKIADLVLLVIDASYGFEMETFEFLNIAAAHGMPKVMTVLTHLDKLKDGKQVRNAKKTFKDRIWAELYDGAKVFYLSGITTTGDYLNREVLNLARFISVTKYANIKWRTDHPYLLADRVEDITPKSLPDYANRSIAAYGYLRGCPLRLSSGEWRIHLAGVGDMIASHIESLTDPCPAPEDTPKNGQKDSKDSTKKKRKVGERERLVHAPMAPEVDGISYDRDAIYISIAEKDIRFSDKSTIIKNAENEEINEESEGDEESDGEGEKMVKTLQKTDGETVDESLKKSSLQIVSGGKKITSEDYIDDRERRRVDFDRISQQSDDDENDSEQSDDDLAIEEPKNYDEDDYEESSSSDGEEDEGTDIDMDQDRSERRWKELTLSNASKRLQNSTSPSKVLFRLIYKKDAKGEYEHYLAANNEKNDSESHSSDENDTDDEFFKPRHKKSNNNVKDHLPSTFIEDSTRLFPQFARDWASNEALCHKLRKARFGTGQKKIASQNNPKDGDEEIIDGDFEDLETGEVHLGADGGAKDDAESGDSSDDDPDTIRSKKIKKKEIFDAEFDQRRGGRNIDDSDDENADKSGKNGSTRREDEERVPDLRKIERERLDKIRESELQGLDDETRIAMEGILPGHYVRLEIQEVPMEFVKYFNPRFPVVVGGLKPSDDDGKTFVRARVRRHRFKRGVLKSSDPIIFSIGWRRFQSMPIYDTEDQGGRHRFLKYTPEYLHCSATFWAPNVAPGAGVVLCQSLGRTKSSFRIAGTGVVTEVNSSFDIVKKLKLIGEPIKIHKNTAFVKGMFNTEMEASKYIGASIRTVSGIRGTIKKAISETAQRGGLDRDIAKSPPGTFRAGFEDKILLSDIVFLRAWVPVEIKKFCSIAATLLEPGTGDGTWRMRTIREVREANQLPIPLQKDSLYKTIERGTPVFAPLKISKKLESSLPYASKPKLFAQKKTKKPKSERAAAITEERAVVLEKDEKKEQRLLQAVYTIRNDRMKKRKQANQKRLAQKKKEWDRANAKHEETSTKKRKRQFAMEGAKEARESKKNRGSDD